jgi:membrane peptidoglycan carboxypeptidase
MLAGMLLLTGLGSFIAVKVVGKELMTSQLQARYLTELGRHLTFHLSPGPSPATRFPTTGPYNERLGYTRLPAFLDRLQAQEYAIEAQARLSPRLQQLIDWGLFPIYHEKTQTGLRLLDRHAKEMYAVRTPERLYTTFEEIPELVVQTLLFIENRELLDARYPFRNPAVEWDRFAKALLDMSVHLVIKGHDVAGGSTLATQLEKLRHSPEGRTSTALEKLRQMVSASIRAYQQGPETWAVRHQLIVDYLNSVPLAALSGYGEVHGLGDGLRAWYAADFAQVNQVLAGPEDAASLATRALAYKQVLSLFLAHRLPSFYLRHHPEMLITQTDRYLHLLSQAGMISPALRDAALQVQLQVQQTAPPEPHESFLARKAVNAIRTDLLTLLGVPSLYDLDRLDLTVQSTLDQPRQEAITGVLRQLSDLAYVEAAGLRGQHLLDKNGNPAKILYSVTLYERTPQANLLRVHTDNFDQPFDLNRGVRLDLGSTAKLRTLITYLEVVAQLHNAYAGLSRQTLLATRVYPADHLSRWAIDYLANTPGATLQRMLEAAMERRYSASPGESFFTGGGLHTFANFTHDDDYKVLAVREAFRHSVNLVFIRMMRDIVYYYMFSSPGATAMLLEHQHPQRQEYLSRFADKEGRVFVQHFYRKYAGRNPDEILDRLLESVQPTPQRFAVLYGSVDPNVRFDAFSTFMRGRFARQLSEEAIDTLYTRYVTAEFTLADRGYLAHTHPLELWVAAYLRRHPEASLSNVITASTEVRQEVYRWLFKTRHKYTQDRRIRTLLEAEAFVKIHQAWQRLGYPFASLVPSYATAIGSSGDRPEALAELMGIIVNDGVRYPIVSIQQLHFAAGTPYEVIVGLPPRGEQVLPPEVATVVKRALLEVVEQGTARRLHGSFRRSDGSIIPVGGKTGTGDHRYETFGRGGWLIASRVVNRAATFVFMLDERFFGTITAYVPGPEAARYSFTSALPVQVLKLLAPHLQPLLQPEPTPVAAMVSSTLPSGALSAR